MTQTKVKAVKEPRQEAHYEQPANASMTAVPETLPSPTPSDEDPEVYTPNRFLQDLRRASRRLTAEVNADPYEIARLRKARVQAQEGKIRWDREGGNDASE
jgi:hypothetical protein